MQQLRRNTVSRVLSYVLIAALLAPQSLVYAPQAFAQTGQNVPAVAVIPFTDATGKATPALMREVTAAAALALEDSKEYVVTSTADLEREMAALRLQPPLATAEQVRLGQRLHVEKVLVGELADLSVDSRSGQARATLRLMLLDVPIGEYLDGAVESIVTKRVPGFTGDVAQVTHEGLRQVAEAAVTKMLGSSVRRGAVELVDDLGNININLGTDDGLALGSELLVMRPTWQPDVEQVVMRRVGVIRITDVESNMSVARSVEGALPTTGDRIYRIYKPASVMQAEARERKLKSATQLGMALLLLVGLVAVATGPNTASPSSLQCALTQPGPGVEPVIRLTWRTPNEARDKTHGWLIFRAANNPDFSADYLTLVAALANPNQNAYSDDQAGEAAEFEITFQFLEDEDFTDGSVSGTYVQPPLIPGNSYYYKIRRITDPLNPPGSNPPIAGGAQIDEPEPIEADPDDRVLSDVSRPCGPVTFFLPPVLSSPADEAVNLPLEDIQFSWNATEGANEYIVQVFPENDPFGDRAPLLQSSIRRSNADSGILLATIHGPFDANTLYWWRVGARNANDPTKPVNLRTGKAQWLYSEMRSFTTVNAPPPGPTSVPGGQRRLPSRHGGWWGSNRSGRQ